MTSQAMTIKAVDAALVTKYTGITIDVGDPAVATSVIPFIEQPLTEQYPERVFPSIAIRLISVTPEYADNVLDSEDLEQEEVEYDDTVDPPVRSMRQNPLPYRLMYSIHTWHRVRAGESRDLVTEALIHRTNPRGYLTVTNVDGTPVNVWMYWSGGVVSSDEVDTDEVIYHKTLTVVVLAYLALTDSATVSEEKVVTEAQLEVSLRHTWTDKDGFHVDDTKNVKDVSIRITETDTEVIP